MRLIGVITLCAAAWSQEQPPAPAVTQAPAGAPVLQNAGKPIVVPFRCTDEDIRATGLSCSEQDPCPVYLELASMDSTGIRLFAAGNIHTSNANLYGILLG